MLFALLYAVLRRVIGSGHPSADRELEIEVVVLRHQVKVLSRKVGRPKLRRIDKAFLACGAQKTRIGPVTRDFVERVS